MNRSKNVVFFSSGISERGLLPYLIDGLTKRNFICTSWRDLFADAKDTKNIALLPMLIKKIPTFDYAVIVCEGHDRTIMSRVDEEILVNTMRDNVIFEIGLCAMALGLDKIVLVTDNTVRMPDDFIGVDNKLAIKRVVYERERMNIEETLDIVERMLTPTETIVDDISNLLINMNDRLSMAVVGAAASTASGYVSNFIFRLLESLNEHMTDACTGECLNRPLDRIYMHIMLPSMYNDGIGEKIEKHKRIYKSGVIKNARHRAISFDYLIKGDELHIYDYPTTLSTSYNTAKIILDIDADDYKDDRAEERFVAKERDLFAFTMKELMHSREFAKNAMIQYYTDSETENRVNQVFDMLNRTDIVEYDIESLV